MISGKTVVRISIGKNGKVGGEWMLHDMDENDTDKFYAIIGCLDFAKNEIMKMLRSQDLDDGDSTDIRKLLDT